MTSADPSNNTPLILLAVLNLDAVNAFPVSCAPTNSLASILLNLLVPDPTSTLPFNVPITSAVMTFAEKLPKLSLATIFPIELLGVASIVHVCSSEPLNSLPII